jgi:hypothetical protein
LLLLGLVGAGMSITALSWNGVLLAEAARLAPEGMRGSATGGVLSFGQIGALLMPLRGLDRQRWLTTSASEPEAPLQRMKLRILDVVPFDPSARPRCRRDCFRNHALPLDERV